MKRKLRLCAVLVAALLATGCMATGGQPSSTPPAAESVPPAASAVATPQQVRLPWFSDDNLNPYTCTTLQNYQLTNLLYDPLVALDSSNIPQKRLALDISTTDYLHYTITLRDDAVFSDGSRLTTTDVLYSLGLAQAAPRFAAGLRGVVSTTAGGDAMLTINLAAPDIFFERSLCFPILKSDSGQAALPVGVGRFVADLENGQLTRNPQHYARVQNISRVQLVETGSLEAQSYGIMEGTLDLMYSDLQSDLNLGLGVGYRQVPLSNLVYLGVNAGRSWATPAMRQAISGLVRRDEIVRRAYTGFAAVTSIPISPVTAATALATADLEVNLEKQKALLDADGWLEQENGTRRKGGIPLELELLVNSGNNEREAAAGLIAEMLRQGGIAVRVATVPFEEYSVRIAEGSYDLCIAETRIAYNMDITWLLAQNDPDGSLAAAFAAMRAGELPQAQLEQTLRERLPVVPLLFRRGILCFSRDFSANIVATEQDIFYNIGEW